MSDAMSDYADCVALLHEAALAAERWPDALEASMRLFGASGILLTDVDTQAGCPRSIQTAGHDPSLLQAYAGHYAAIDPTITVGMQGANGTVYHLREHFSDRQMARMEYFQDFLFAFGVADVMATPIDYAPDARLFVSLQRQFGEAAFDETAHPLLALFSRQVNLAKQTETRLRMMSSSNQALAGGLDAFAASLFIVDSAAAVLHHNQAAYRLLGAGQGVEIRARHLQLAATGAHSRLLHAIRGATRTSGRAEAFAMTGPDLRRLQLLITPLHPNHALNASWRVPLALVIVSDPHQMTITATKIMRELYRLTAAEARLVAELAEGNQLRDIAGARDVALSTLRTQLMSAFGKSGVRRQVDLVRLVMALAPIASEQQD